MTVCSVISVVGLLCDSRFVSATNKHFDNEIQKYFMMVCSVISIVRLAL